MQNNKKEILKAKKPHAFFKMIRHGVSHIKKNGILRSSIAFLNSIREWIWFASHRKSSISLRQLNIIEKDLSNQAHSTFYVPTPIVPFLKLIKSLKLPKNPVFVDYGAGKGRAMLLAAECLCFTKIKGLEFSPSLYKAAKQNLKSYQDKGGLGHFSLLQTDVVQYKVQLEDNVFYFFHPFNESILKSCLSAIFLSLRQNPREAILIYQSHSKDNTSLITEDGFFKPLKPFVSLGARFYIYNHTPFASKAEEGKPGESETSKGEDFTLMSGAGNSFYVLNRFSNNKDFAGEQEPINWSEKTRELCRPQQVPPLGSSLAEGGGSEDRGGANPPPWGTGGVDGVAVLLPSKGFSVVEGVDQRIGAGRSVPPAVGGDFKWLFYNADGSSAEMCGNAACCLVEYVFKKKLLPFREPFSVTFEIGPLTIKGAWDLKSNRPKVFMPLNQGAISGPYECTFNDQKLSYMFINSGVPHAVIELKTWPSVSNLKEWEQKKQLAKALRGKTDHHKAGMNVSFYSVVQPNRLLARSFERGVEDFTSACGTGALALACVHKLRLNKGIKEVFVQMPGGILQVGFQNEKSLSLISPVKWLNC